MDSKGERKFGWPAMLSDKRPFCTCHANAREFERLMDYVTAVSEYDWVQI